MKTPPPFTPGNGDTPQHDAPNGCSVACCVGAMMPSDLSDLRLFCYGEWEDEDAEFEDIQCGIHSPMLPKVPSKVSVKQ